MREALAEGEARYSFALSVEHVFVGISVPILSFDLGNSHKTFKSQSSIVNSEGCSAVSPHFLVVIKEYWK